MFNIIGRRAGRATYFWCLIHVKFSTPIRRLHSFGKPTAGSIEECMSTTLLRSEQFYSFSAHRFSSSGIFYYYFYYSIIAKNYSTLICKIFRRVPTFAQRFSAWKSGKRTGAGEPFFAGRASSSIENSLGGEKPTRNVD